ncbi:MAG: glutamine amidotransferase-related protein [Lawsonibacter sp.]
MTEAPITFIQLIGQIEPNTVILHHDRIEPSQVLTMAPSHIVLSSGSGTPERAGSAVEIVRACAGRIPILGICLGCRIICAAYGGKITLMEQVEQGEAKTRSCGVPWRPPLQVFRMTFMLAFIARKASWRRASLEGSR